MPTVIDSLILELSIDPRRFSEGQREAVDSLRKMQEASEAAGKRIEASGHKVTDVLGMAKRGAVGLMGAFVGYEMATALDGIARLDAGLARLSRSTGQSVEQLSEWSGAVHQAGGEVTDAANAIAGMQQFISQFSMGMTQMPGGFGSLQNRVGDLRRMTPQQEFLALARLIDQEVAAGRARGEPEGAVRARMATLLREAPGMNEGMLNFILRGEEAMRKMLAASRQLGGTADESAELAERYVQNTAKIERFFASVFRGILDVFMYPFADDALHAKVKARADAIVSRPSGTFSGINPEFSSSLGKLSAAMPAGMGFTVNSGFRTTEQQAELYRKHPDLAARPGTSPHERGMAADLQFSSDAARAWAHAHAVEFGLSFPVGREPWHAEPARGGRGGAFTPLPRSDPRRGGAGGTVNTSSVSIQNMTIVTQAKDAAGIANDIGDHLKRVAKVMPANYGLV